VTPIEEMLEINALDHSAAAGKKSAPLRREPTGCGRKFVPGENAEPTQTASPGEARPALPAQNYSNYLEPIETPLVFNGFSDETLQRYGRNSRPRASFR
jgi:hypothetical protein